MFSKTLNMIWHDHMSTFSRTRFLFMGKFRCRGYCCYIDWMSDISRFHPYTIKTSTVNFLWRFAKANSRRAG